MLSKNIDLWAGTFGDEYTVRNDVDYGPREDFWKRIMQSYEPHSVLEVGCNTGMNLQIIEKYVLDKHKIWGVDVNESALRMGKHRNIDMNLCYASGFDLPFADGEFDLVFTCGVLIHYEKKDALQMMSEIVRVSKNHVLALEYSNNEFEEIPYRGEKNFLYCGPYGEAYEQAFGVKLIENGDLNKEDGFDRVHFWVFSRS